MTETRISLADAKARLSELAERAAKGENIIITKRGKPVLQLSLPEQPRAAINREVLSQLTDKMPKQKVSAGRFMRKLRDDSRY